jgi:hypothetical protein
MLKYNIQKVCHALVNPAFSEGEVLSCVSDSDVDLAVCKCPGVYGYGAVVGNSIKDNMQCQHTELLDALSTNLASTISSSINFIKNVVVGEIENFRDELDEHVSRFDSIDPAKLFNIEVLVTHRPLRDMIIPVSLSSFSGKRTPEFSGYKINVPFSQDHLDWLGKPNDSITEWAKTLNSESIDLYWGLAFGDRISSKRIDVIIKELSMHERIDFALLILFAVKNFMAGAPSFTTGSTISEFNRLLESLKAYFGVVLFRSIKFMNQVMRTGRVIARNDKDNKTIYVYEENYNKYLDSGGTIEAILGRSIRDEGDTNIKGLLQESISYISSYNSYFSFLKGQEASNRLNFVRSALKVITRDRVKEMSSDNMYGSIDLQQQLTNTLAIINSLRIYDLNNLDRVVLKVVAKGLFSFTSAYDHLRYMEEVALKNPDIDPNEASLIATLEYLGRYIGKQIYLTGKDGFNGITT